MIEAYFFGGKPRSVLQAATMAGAAVLPGFVWHVKYFPPLATA